MFTDSGRIVTSKSGMHGRLIPGGHIVLGVLSLRVFPGVHVVALSADAVRIRGCFLVDSARLNVLGRRRDTASMIGRHSACRPYLIPLRGPSICAF